ncbi:MAG: chemosensory pili system protein ChpA (sensor histidine kinase/response regulator), partial [Paraglaciecola psychrophila]
MTMEPLAPSLHENVKIKFGCNVKGLTVMSERRDYVALEWVAGEINETLDLAEQALQEYNDNPQDISKLRFCLSHLHQVHGTLQMVEFFGAGLLAAEMKAVATALIEGTIHDSHRTDAQAVLSQAIALLPRYLAQVKKSRHTLPATLLPVLNDLRAVRGESLLSETVLFSVSLEDAGDDLGGATEALDDDQLRAVANKLRQMFQIALLGLIRGQQLQKNLNYLAKVCARLVKLSAGQPSQPLWRVCIAVLEGLLNGSIETSVAVKMLLRQVDREIKALVDEGQDALRRAPAPALLKNLLYYVARSDAESKYILEIKDRYKLQQALPGLGELGDDVLQLPDANTLSALVAALRLELEDTSVALAQVAGNGGNGELLAELVATLGRSCDALAILGLGGTLKQATAVRSGLAARLGAGGAIGQPELENFAAAIVAVQRSLGAGDTIALAAAGLPPRGLQQQSYEDLVRQSRPGLALVKEAIIEYVATQCDRQALMTMPAILSGVSDRLAAGGLNAAATIIDSCNRYMSEELLAAPSTPSWQQLDTLADALASVDYYLERIAEDEAEVGDAILDVAANSVAALRYPLANTAALEQPVQEVAAPVAAELVTELATELATEVSAAEELLAGADIAA